MQSSSVTVTDSSVSFLSPQATDFPLTPIERGWKHRRYSILREILGPDFHGPSSSHTAAPQLIAFEAFKMLGNVPEVACVKLVNSFATTGDGHRTPIAIVAGLMGITTNDPRTPMALKIAEEDGVNVEFKKVEDQTEHPNTLELMLQHGTNAVYVKAISIGGGNFEVLEKRSFTVVA